MLYKAREAFVITYDRHPTEGEISLIQTRMAAVPIGHRPRDLLRSMNCFFDRDFHSTPISIRFGQENLITVDFGDFQMLLDQDDWSVSRHIALTKSYEPWLTSLIRGNVKTGMTAIDVGANIGVHSMLLARIVGPHGKVVSFEPNSENCRLILLNAEKNQFKNIELLPLALSEIRGFALFRTGIGSNGCMQSTTTDTLLDHKCIVVPCERLDALLHDQPIHFIKADIEGAEYRALCGAETILRKQRPIVTAEFSLEMVHRVSGIDGADFLRWMKSLDYRVVLIDRDGITRHDVSDIDALIADWGSYTRIEDLAFIPNT